MDQLFNEVAGVTPYEISDWKPAVEFHDAGDYFTLKAQLPGLKPEDIDVSVMRDRVMLSGEYRQQKKDKTHSEFYYGKFERTVGLPFPVQNDKVEVEEAVNRVVKVNLGGNEPAAIEGEANAG
jgi:HSP20 family protein